MGRIAIDTQINSNKNIVYQVSHPGIDGYYYNSISAEFGRFDVRFDNEDGLYIKSSKKD